jgi:O-antigen/teichoic acid export membrane protein
MEQGFLSVGSFGLAIFLARQLPKGEWGAFSLGLAVMLFAQGFQRALVSIPVATMAHRDDLLWSSLGFWQTIQSWLTLITVTVFSLAAALLWTTMPESCLTTALLISGIMVPGYFSMEFWRRILIQAGRVREAAFSGLVFLLLILLLIALLRFSDHGATAAAAGTSLSALAAGMVSRRFVRSGMPAGGARGTSPFSGRSLYQFGRWAILSHVAYSGYNTAIQVILSVVCGPAAMGSFAAVRNLTQPVNTLIGAIDNLDKPRAARAFAAEGFPGLFSSLWRTMGTLSLFGGAYLFLCTAGGGYAVNLLYHGRYGHAWGEVWMWCAIALAMMAAQPLESGLYVSGRTDSLFVNRLISAGIGLGTAAIAIPALGVPGALLSLVAGWSATALFAACQLFLFSRQAGRLGVIDG